MNATTSPKILTEIFCSSLGGYVIHVSCGVSFFKEYRFPDNANAKYRVGIDAEWSKEAAVYRAQCVREARKMAKKEMN